MSCQLPFLIFLSISCIVMVKSKQNFEDTLSFDMKLKSLEDRFNEKMSFMQIQIEELKKETHDLHKIIDQNNFLPKNDLTDTPKEVLEDPSLEARVLHLEEVAKTKLLRTCEELFQHGVSLSGVYHLDPDGELVGHPPIRAFCDMENHMTEILHDADNQSITIDHCDTEHCFAKKLNYLAPMDQIQSLIELSSHCEQSIEFDCFLTPLNVNQVDLGVWTDRFEEEQNYFYGENYNNHVCSCSSFSNCSGQQIFQNQCNCDNTADAEWMEDMGKITNMSALPITGFKYGPLLYEMQEAKVKIGRLRCGGKVEVDMPPSSCGDLKRMGETREGLYALKDGENNNFPKMSYCEMNKSGYGEDLETESHWIKWSSGSAEVVFAVQHTGENDIPQNSYITFDKEVINIGESMNAETGEFISLVDGKYQFSLNGLGKATTGALCIDIYLNDIHYLRWYDHNSYGPSGVSRVWFMDLKIGYTLKLKKCSSGEFYGNVHSLEFNGLLM